MVLLALSCAAGCARNQSDLTLVLPESPVDQAVATSLADVFSVESDIHLSLTNTQLTEELAIRSLLDGAADIALISNSMPYQEGIATVLPMYPTVLHVGYTGQREFADLTELLRDADVFAGPEGSASRVMFRRMVNRPDADELHYRFVEEPDATNIPDVFVVFAPISPEIMREQLMDAPPFTAVGMGSPDDIGKGSIVDAATLVNPYFRPFVIPVGTYGDLTPEPVLTLAVDKMLVARRDLDRSVVYDLISELVRLRPALAAQQPGLFQALKGEFDASRSTFVMHQGAQAYLQREAPSVYERYSGIAEVVVTVIVALASATFAGVRIFRMRRKNRIDTFYSEAIRIRASVTGDSSDDDRQAAISRIRDLQNNAFELLVDEKLAADESFRIFITLSNDVLQQLSEPS